MQYLQLLNNDTLTDLVENKLKLSRWFIREDNLQDRLACLKGTTRYSILKTFAKSNKIQAIDTEIVTWIDTLHLLYCTFNRISDSILKDEITIIQEFCIPYTNKRADYILLHKNKILILEFSFNKLNYPLNYETKLQQVIGYKELLSNLLPNEIEIYTHTIIIDPECDHNGFDYADKNNQLPNNSKLDNLANLITMIFTKDKDLAYKSLQNL